MCAPGRAAHTTASLDAQTPGVRTTRFCRPRTSRPGHPEARACSPPKPKGDAVTAPCRSRGSRWLTGVARPAIPSRAGAAASIASRPAYRDDRETPLWRAGMFCGLPEEAISVNQNISNLFLDLHVACFARQATRGIVRARRLSAPASIDGETTIHATPQPTSSGPERIWPPLIACGIREPPQSAADGCFADLRACAKPSMLSWKTRGSSLSGVGFNPLHRSLFLDRGHPFSGGLSGVGHQCLWRS